MSGNFLLVAVYNLRNIHSIGKVKLIVIGLLGAWLLVIEFLEIDCWVTFKSFFGTFFEERNQFFEYQGLTVSFYVKMTQQKTTFENYVAPFGKMLIEGTKPNNTPNDPEELSDIWNLLRRSVCKVSSKVGKLFKMLDFGLFF